MPLPTIKHFIRTPDDAWLLTTAIPGKTAFQVLEEYPDSGENIVDALAVFLRRLHSIPVCNCPFNSDRVFRLVCPYDFDVLIARILPSYGTASVSFLLHWTQRIDEIGARGLWNRANSWYRGANVPTKPLFIRDCA